MALFGFGKKKKDNEPKEKSEEAVVRVQKAKIAPSTVRKPNPAAKSAIKRPGVVKRPSVALRPQQKEESTRSVVAKAVEQASHTSQRKIRTSTKNKQVGQLLLSAEKITQDQLNKALAWQQESGGLLGQILVRMEFCLKADVAAVLKKQRTITTVDLNTLDFEPDALKLLSRDFCEKNKLIPFEVVGTQLFLAMSNALDTMAKNEVKDQTQMHIKIFDSSNDDIQKAIAKNYPGGDSAIVDVVSESTSIAEAAKIEEGSGLDDLVIEIPGDGEDEIALDEIPVADLEPVGGEQEEIDVIGFDDELDLADEVISLDDEVLSDVEEVAEVSSNTAATVDFADDPFAFDEETLEDEVEVAPAKSLSVRERISMMAIPVPGTLKKKIVKDGKVDLVELWVEDKKGEEVLPAAMPIKE